MQLTKRQHYVPQSYLRRFTYEGNMLWAFDKVSKRSFRSNTTGIAQQRYFYDFGAEMLAQLKARIEAVPDAELPPEAKRRLLDPQFVEHDLSSIEDEFATTVDHVLDSVATMGSFTREQQERMAAYITRQILRSPEFRAAHIERMNKAVKEISQMLVAMRFGPDAVGSVKVAINESTIAYEHARAMYDPKMNAMFISVLLNHAWHIGINDTTMPFYASDNPVILRSHIEGAPPAVGAPGIEIDFPLTPNHMLVICDRNYFPAMIAAHRRALSVGPENVLYFNSGQVMQAYKQVYSQVPRFELAVDVCARLPHLCDPRRERIAVRGGVQSWAAQGGSSK